MRIVFMGTPKFAVRQLAELTSTGHELACVVTAPDRRAGRGRKPAPSPVKTHACQAGLSVITPEDVNAPEVIARLAEVSPDVMVVAAFGQKLAQTLLTVPKRGCFNVHPSLLPKYRGAAPVNWALINGEKTTGVTIQTMSRRFDAGAIAEQCEVEIDPTWNAADLADELAEVGAGLLKDVLSRLEAGTLELVEQPRTGITKAPQLRKSDGVIDWTQPASNIHNRVRGITPWPGAQVTHVDNKGKTLGLLLTETAVVASETGAGEAGEVVALTDEGIDVACGDGTLRILKLKPAGSREMSADEFLRGHRWQTGDRLVCGS